MQKGSSGKQLAQLGKYRAREYALESDFKLGYRNKEDISNLPSYVLVVGSQNVLTNAAEQVGIRQGYTLDGGAGNQNTYGIDSAYDFLTKIGNTQNLRKWGTNLEVRYQNPSTSSVSWINIYASLNASKLVNFTNFWDLNGEVSMFCLFVNGDNNVYEWSGGVGAFASATSTTITLQGTQTLAQLGFYNTAANAGKYKFIIDGVTYTYTAAGYAPTTAYTASATGGTQDLVQYVSQKFTTGASAQSLYSATIQVINNFGATLTDINLIGYVYTDNAGVPGTLIGTTSSSLSTLANGANTSMAFSFSNLAISPATAYHFIVHTLNPAALLKVYTDTNPATGTNVSTDLVTWSPVNGGMYATIVENDSGVYQFTGVSPDPTVAGIQVGDAVIQSPTIGVAGNTANTNFPSNFNLDLIATLSNQVWYGNLTSSNVYVSKVNNYKNTTFSSPQRLPGEGALLILDSPCVGFSPQGTLMFVTSGESQWWQSAVFQQTVVVSGISTPTETLYLERLKTATGQASQSQALIARFKNSLIYVSNEPIINSFGLIQNIQQQPQIENMSDPIKYDVDAYDFTDGQVFYFNYFIYVTIPRMGVVRMFNVNKQYWEAPQLLPISRFYVVDGQLYGHNYSTNESYQLFTGYNDNGNPISAVAAFPYVSQGGGSANQKKSFNKHYTEGYIAGNTAITLTINYDFGGFSGNYSTTISGTDPAIIFNKVTDGSLGQNPLGSQPIGTILNLVQQPPIPKFRVINTFPRINVYEYQLVYSSNDIDQQWTLLRLGPAIGASEAIPVEITE